MGANLQFFNLPCKSSYENTKWPLSSKKSVAFVHTGFVHTLSPVLLKSVFNELLCWSVELQTGLSVIAHVSSLYTRDFSYKESKQEFIPFRVA